MSLFVKEIFKGDTTLEDLKSKPGLIKEIRGRLVELAAIDDKHSWRLEATKDGGDVSVYEAVEEVSTHTITKKYEFQMEMPASEWPQYALSSKFKTFQVLGMRSISPGRLVTCVLHLRSACKIRGVG